MATVTASPARVIRSFSRTLPPVKETRIAPVPATPFGIGLEDAVLAKSWTCGEFHFDVVEFEGADNDYPLHLYISRNGVLLERKPCDTMAECEAYAYHVATPMPVEVEPEAKPDPVAVRKPATRPVNRPSFPLRVKGHTADDERWWASHSPTCRSFYFVEGSVDPYDVFNNTMSAFDYHCEEMLVPCLSDDYTDALATGCREGGDR